jgi:hypothetical protein
MFLSCLLVYKISILSIYLVNLSFAGLEDVQLIFEFQMMVDVDLEIYDSCNENLGQMIIWV